MSKHLMPYSSGNCDGRAVTADPPLLPTSACLLQHGFPPSSVAVRYGLQLLAAMGKAKPAKHTAAELAAKAKAATQNAGGGKAGLADRKGGAVGHAKYKWVRCGGTMLWPCFDHTACSCSWC